jgi:hypothetical protein
VSLVRPLRWLASRRLRQLEAVWRNPLESEALTDYRTKRIGDVGMEAPRVTPVAPGNFGRWLRTRMLDRPPADPEGGCLG